MMITEEQVKLQEYSSIYNPDQDFDSFYTKATAKRIKKWVKSQDRILELGSAMALMTSVIATGDVIIECVEVSERYIDIAKQKNLPGVTFHHSSMEDFTVDDKFDHILLTGVLHELENPLIILQKINGWLQEGGKLHITVPNPESIHKKVALLAGSIQDLKEKSARAVKLFTKELYYNNEIINLVEGCTGLECIHQDGILFKPLPNSEMEKLDENILWAFDELGHEFINNSAMTYFVFGKGQ